jgi:hypothetical protein
LPASFHKRIGQLDLHLAAHEASPLCASSPKAQRAAINRANSAHSTGPRTESGKQRSSLNALGHGLTARTPVLPTEDPDTYQRHLQKYVADYAPATITESQLVQEMADTAWRLNRIPFLEDQLLSRALHPPSEQAAMEFDMVDANVALATLALYGSRLSRQYQKALDKLREIQDDRRRLERKQLHEAAEIWIRHQHQGLSWEPSDDGFVFSKQQIERHARELMRQNPGYYDPHSHFQAAPPLTRAAF